MTYEYACKCVYVCPRHTYTHMYEAFENLRERQS